ncbi:MAG TPA: hypothetical protein VNS32_28075 [Flavisolibacter sp.]|nr:hypothetical protein [Flavisolibacter sp.]
MNLLSVLIIVQVTGILLSGLCVSFHSKNKRKRMGYQRYLTAGNVHDEDWPWLMEYFQAFPESSLKATFPGVYKIAMATKRFKELKRLKSRGDVSDKQYEREMKKILPFLNSRSGWKNHESM